jgi:hypothetical protein
MLLVGGDWNMNVIFPSIGNFIIPTDELIFFRGVETTNQVTVTLENGHSTSRAWRRVSNCTPK